MLYSTYPDVCYSVILYLPQLLCYKSYCMVFKPKSYNLSCPRLYMYMDNQLLKYTDDIKNLGFTFSSD